MQTDKKIDRDTDRNRLNVKNPRQKKTTALEGRKDAHVIIMAGQNKEEDQRRIGELENQYNVERKWNLN